jgi:hypothetical protein
MKLLTAPDIVPADQSKGMERAEILNAAVDQCQRAAG